MRCSAADTNIQQLERVVSGASFLTRDVLERDIAHGRSVAVLSMLYKIICNQTHRLYGALPVPYVSIRVSRSALVAHRYTICHSSLQNLAVSQDLYSPLSLPGERSCLPYQTVVFQEQGQCVLIGPSCSILFCLLLIFPFSCFFL